MRRFFAVLESRRAQVILGGIYIVALPAVMGLFLHELAFSPLRILVVEVLLTSLVTLLVERVLSSTGAIAFILANDLRLSLLASAITMASAFLASTNETGIVVEPLTGGVSPVAATTLYFLLGAVLGATLRRFVAGLLLRALFGRPRFAVSLSFAGLCFITVAFAVLPVHRNAITPYILGVGAGVLIYRGFALWLERTGAASRRLFEVQSSIPTTLPLSQNDRTALELLAQGRSPLTMKFSALTRHLAACRAQGPMSKCLRLVSACTARLEARYTDAIDDTKNVSEPPADSLDAQLLLIRALSMEDKGDIPDAEIEALLKVISSSHAGGSCPLTRALMARRASERSISTTGTLAISKDPLVQVVASLDLRRNVLASLEETRPGGEDEGAEFFRRLTTHGVPVTPSWLLDVFGYALLIAGCPEEGRVFLQRCISLDPAYSYGYLHLCDYFLLRRTMPHVGGHRANPGKSGTWHARACYKLAAKVERNAASRVRRIALKRLELVETLQSR